MALAELNIQDVAPGVTKRHRLAQALLAHQQRSGGADRLITLITHAMAPSDTAARVDAALLLGSSGTPGLAINSLSTVTDRDEQKGFANLIKGLSGMYRNPVAHDPRLLRKDGPSEPVGAP